MNEECYASVCGVCRENSCGGCIAAVTSVKLKGTCFENEDGRSLKDVSASCKPDKFSRKQECTPKKKTEPIKISQTKLSHK